MDHAELVSDLAETFDPELNVVFRERAVLSRHFNSGQVPVPDLLVFHKSYRHPDIRVYEVKATRADLLSDLRKGKWERYLPYCDRIYFALGDGFEWKDKLDHLAVGIIVRGKRGWKTIKAAPRNPHREPLTEEVFFALLFGGIEQRTYRNRIDRLTTLKEILLKKEILQLTKSCNKWLADQAEQLMEKERDLKIREERAERDGIELVRKALGLNKTWYSNITVEQLLEEFILKPMSDKARKGLKRLLEYVEHDEKPDNM